MKWYGLLRDGELIAVQRFSQHPTIFDFNMEFNSKNDYDVVTITCIDY